MKKGLVSGLVFALVAFLGLGFAACTDDQPTATTRVSATTSTKVETDTTAIETTSTSISVTTSISPTTSISTTTTTLFPQEPMTLAYATTFARDEASGRVIRRFIDEVEEATAGAITFDVFFDGTLGSAAEELALVRSGSVDMVSLRFPAFPDQLPLLCLPGWKPGDGQKVVDGLDHVAFENPDTAPLIQAEAKANNITYVGFIAGGANVFVGREPFNALSDLDGGQFGAAAPTAALEALGVTVAETSSAGMYEALAGGVVDVTRASFFTTVDLKWYESATYYMWDGTYAAGNAFSVNLGAWGKLSPQTQEVFREAALEAEAFSRELSAEEVTASTRALEEAGVTFGTLSPEDQAVWSLLLFEGGASECMTRAVTLGIVNDMATVLSAAAAFTGIAWAPPAQ
ncbi:MAG: TRAP transporter substrate-binding protein DctP [Thermoleophilia bacterium]|nr:TRAP transporter substrate-binding protein DctP [Thermoleophilia bacterium]